MNYYITITRTLALLFLIVATACAPAATPAGPASTDTRPATELPASPPPTPQTLTATQEAVLTYPTPVSAPTDTPIDTMLNDLDLTIILRTFSAPPQAEGQAIVLYGRLLDSLGNAIPGAAFEIWQTDAHGRYDHPASPGTTERDMNFQFYGTSVTDNIGLYFFRTLIPGEYEPRPPHIHLKVKIDGREALTTQFYFAKDRDMLASEGLFQAAGELGELLILDPQPIPGEANLQVAYKDIVLLAANAAALTLTPTPPQGEGPYYPLIDVSRFDNDLLAP